MLRSRLSTLSGVSRHLSESAYGSASRRTTLCQLHTPPQPRLLTIGLARYNSTSTPPPRPPPTKNQGSSSSQDQSYGSECFCPGASKLGIKLITITEKLNRAWSTPTKWYPIPIALGALVLLAVQFRKQQRESDDITVDAQREGAVVRSSKLDGPWQVSHCSDRGVGGNVNGNGGGMCEAEPYTGLELRVYALTLCRSE